MADGAEATPNVEIRVGKLERWQGIVDYRLGEGEQRFKDINEKLVQQSEKQNQMALDILTGNRDTSDLKRSWETWLKEYKTQQQESVSTRKQNRPHWWAVAVAAAAFVVGLIALIRSVMG